MFDIRQKVAVITGGGGVLGGSIAVHLAREGVKVAILDIRQENVDKRVEELQKMGFEAEGFTTNVLDMDILKQTRDQILSKWQRVDIQINAAGGNLPGATLTEEQTIFDMKIEDYQKVTDLNLNGTVFPSLVLPKPWQNRGKEVSSMYRQWLPILL